MHFLSLNYIFLILSLKFFNILFLFLFFNIKSFFLKLCLFQLKLLQLNLSKLDLKLKFLYLSQKSFFSFCFYKKKIFYQFSLSIFLYLQIFKEQKTIQLRYYFFFLLDLIFNNRLFFYKCISVFALILILFTINGKNKIIIIFNFLFNYAQFQH